MKEESELSELRLINDNTYIGIKDNVLKRRSIGVEKYTKNINDRNEGTIKLTLAKNDADRHLTLMIISYKPV
jgi:hypothetical protein